MYLRMTAHPPTAQGVRVVSYALGAYKVHTERVMVYNSEVVIGLVIISSSVLFKIQSDRRMDTFPLAIARIFPKYI